ncbi:hypothetical protein ECANGB1_1821 [Enterospora canceri]|uniref:Uncharacterized protein n=1 Tax=Enterospora canceri TaxID=1081671 RepID=A0A1Y1S3V0_9MICR|nr:hypothetical protein ECANGB1_1821 [Enterospora canceri]
MYIFQLLYCKYSGVNNCANTILRAKIHKNIKEKHKNLRVKPSKKILGILCMSYSVFVSYRSKLPYHLSCAIFIKHYKVRFNCANAQNNTECNRMMYFSLYLTIKSNNTMFSLAKMPYIVFY